VFCLETCKLPLVQVPPRSANKGCPFPIFVHGTLDCSNFRLFLTEKDVFFPFVCSFSGIKISPNFAACIWAQSVSFLHIKVGPFLRFPASLRAALPSVTGKHSLLEKIQPKYPMAANNSPSQTPKLYLHSLWACLDLRPLPISLPYDGID